MGNSGGAGFPSVKYRNGQGWAPPTPHFGHLATTGSMQDVVQVGPGGLVPPNAVAQGPQALHMYFNTLGGDGVDRVVHGIKKCGEPIPTDDGGGPPRSTERRCIPRRYSDWVGGKILGGVDLQPSAGRGKGFGTLGPKQNGL